MPIVVDGFLPVFSYRHAQRMARRRRFPTSHWDQLANSARATVGPSPGRAWLLMHKSDLDQLDTTKGHTITFSSAGSRIDLLGYWFISSSRILPGGPNDPNALHVAEWADPRYFCKNPFYAITAVKNYNVRAPAAAQTYYQDSLNNGQPWTWQQILDDLWAALIAGTPQINNLASQPLVTPPDGTPEGFRFLGVPVWDAYNAVLERAGGGIFWDYTQAAMNVWQHVADDPPYRNAINQWANRLVYQSANLFAGSAYVPEKLTVYFPSVRQHYGTELATGWDVGQQDTMTPLQSVDQADPNPNGPLNLAQPGTRAGVFDDLPALLDPTGAVTNQAALNSRAQDRANYYYNLLRGPALKRAVRIWQGIISDSNLTLPRAWVSGVSWRESGGGMTTEVVTYPPWVPPTALRITDDGKWYPPDGGPGAAVMERLRPPDFGRITFPNYPPPVQPLLNFGGGPVPMHPTIYDGRVQQINPAAMGGPMASNGEKCWIWSITGQTLAQGQQVFGKVTGFGSFDPGTGAEQRPIYTLIAGGGSGDPSFVARLIGEPSCGPGLFSGSGGPGNLGPGRYYLWLTWTFANNTRGPGTDWVAPGGGLGFADVFETLPGSHDGYISVTPGKLVMRDGVTMGWNGPFAPPADATGWKVWMATRNDPQLGCTAGFVCSTFSRHAQSAAGNFTSGLNIYSALCNGPELAPPYSYSWVEQAVALSADSPLTGANYPHGYTACYQDKAGGRTGNAWGANPAFETALSLQAYTDGSNNNISNVLVRLYPGFQNPAAAIGQEYTFMGGFSGQKVRVEGASCDAQGNPVWYYSVDGFNDGRLIYNC